MIPPMPDKNRLGGIYLFDYLKKENAHIGIFSGLFYEIKRCLYQKWHDLLKMETFMAEIFSEISSNSGKQWENQ